MLAPLHHSTHATTRQTSHGTPRPSSLTPAGVLLLLAGTDPYYLVDAGVAAAAALSGGAKPRAQKRLPPSLDAFGWCTWDAFYSTVSARGLQEGLASLNSGGVYPRLLIIDDGWQLTDVDAPYSKAPTSQLADKMKVQGQAKEFLETTQVGGGGFSGRDFWRLCGDVEFGIEHE